jgi:alkylation response protein AidB-like acyl-CoA dehydrogenase
MEFDLSEEQAALADSLRRLLADRYDQAARARHLEEPDGFSAARWQDFVDLGLTALPFDERHGGLAAGAVETMVVMQAFGHALVIEPYLAAIVLGGAALRLGGSTAQQDRLLPAVAAGTVRLSLAYAEAGARFDLADIACTARPAGAGWVLDGRKVAAIGADSAHAIIVAARHAGSRRDPSGIGLFLVDAAALGLQRRGYAALDGTRAAELLLQATPAEALGNPAQGFAVLTHAVEHGIAATAAEGLGVMEAIEALTLDYLRTRRQFGRTIGSFQALQHRAVDMRVMLEQARSMVWLATAAVTLDDADERARMLAAAKVQVARSLTHIAEESVQLHGGIGVTLEYRLGHLVRRATALAALFGDADHHLRRLAAMGGVFRAA